MKAEGYSERIERGERERKEEALKKRGATKLGVPLFLQVGWWWFRRRRDVMD
jgi:hypothetical protein